MNGDLSVNYWIYKKDQKFLNNLIASPFAYLILFFLLPLPATFLIFLLSSFLPVSSSSSHLSFTPSPFICLQSIIYLQLREPFHYDGVIKYLVVTWMNWRFSGSESNILRFPPDEKKNVWEAKTLSRQSCSIKPCKTWLTFKHPSEIDWSSLSL